MEETCSTYAIGGLLLVGDQVWKNAPIVYSEDDEHYMPFELLDAVINIDVSSNMGSRGYMGSEAVDAFYQVQREWRDAAWRSNCGYIPSVIPGYNNRVTSEHSQSPIKARRLDPDSDEGSFFEKSLECARYLVDSTFSNLKYFF